MVFQSRTLTIEFGAASIIPLSKYFGLVPRARHRPEPLNGTVPYRCGPQPNPTGSHIRIVIRLLGDEETDRLLLQARFRAGASQRSSVRIAANWTGLIMWTLSWLPNTRISSSPDTT